VHPPVSEHNAPVDFFTAGWQAPSGRRETPRGPRWLRLMAGEPGSIPGALVVLASPSGSLHTTSEVLASGKGDGMPRSHAVGRMMRRADSAMFVVGAGVGGNLIAGMVPGSA
jgi:hypothetical protein